MNTAAHTMENLFRQLGLPSSPEAIAEFIDCHRLQKYTALDEASFWTRAQAEFIHECWQDDADWVGVVDQLDAHLRE